ncbi:SRPBCC family protein [Streptomyces sp. NPDC047108]|uniref:SRPBCC family protein n=1 Tax=Streptomyces sp. NPDC047108 TaxID=3155025 RepID=UPI0033F9A1DC
MERAMHLEEITHVRADPERVFRLVSDVRNMKRWSPECVGVLPLGPPSRVGSVFLGFNRKRFFVWFTRCKVTEWTPGQSFAFRVDAFGVPIAEWGYRVAADQGGTRLTESWTDVRTGRSARFAHALGVIFTGTTPEARVGLNRAGMRATLDAVRRHAEASG